MILRKFASRLLGLTVAGGTLVAATGHADAQDSAKLEAGREEREIATVDVSAVLGGVCQGLKGLAEGRGLFFTVEAAPSMVVPTDESKVRRIAQNLIVNAIESMSGVSDGPRDLLVSTAREASGDVAVVVEDSGSGLTEPALGNLFDPFHTTKAGGLGLGLSICRSIIEAHGGRLRARANAPRGAIFQFLIPTA